MELTRGKTFIKSSLQIDHEKPPDPAATALITEDAISLGGQQLPHSEPARSPDLPSAPTPRPHPRGPRGARLCPLGGMGGGGQAQSSDRVFLQLTPPLPPHTLMLKQWGTQ